MELIIKGKLENIFKAKDFLNKSTGETSVGKWQLQFMERIEGDEGAQLVVHKVSIPEEKQKLYKDKVGDLINLPVKAMISKNSVIYYGI